MPGDHGCFESVNDHGCSLEGGWHPGIPERGFIDDDIALRYSAEQKT